jgi:hypothetical protein
MEKDVGSTSPVYVAAAATWATWAVGAVTAKFYKVLLFAIQNFRIIFQFVARKFSHRID